MASPRHFGRAEAGIFRFRRGNPESGDQTGSGRTLGRLLGDRKLRRSGSGCWFVFLQGGAGRSARGGDRLLHVSASRRPRHRDRYGPRVDPTGNTSRSSLPTRFRSRMRRARYCGGAVTSGQPRWSTRKTGWSGAGSIRRSFRAAQTSPDEQLMKSISRWSGGGSFARCPSFFDDSEQHRSKSRQEMPAPRG